MSPGPSFRKKILRTLAERACPVPARLYRRGPQENANEISFATIQSVTKKHTDMGDAFETMDVSYQWQNVYLEAVLEVDTSKLAQRIAAAEDATDARATELKQDHHGTPKSGQP
jgi:hypothetical protein